MSDYKINPRTGKFDMVGTASDTPGDGSGSEIPEISGNPNALLVKSEDGWVKSSKNVLLMEDENTSALVSSGYMAIGGASGFTMSMPESDVFEARVITNSTSKQLNIETYYGGHWNHQRMGIDFQPEVNSMLLSSSGDMTLSARDTIELSIVGNNISGGTAIQISLDDIMFSTYTPERGNRFFVTPTRIYYQNEEPVLSHDGFAFWVNGDDFWLILNSDGVQKKTKLL